MFIIHICYRLCSLKKRKREPRLSTHSQNNSRDLNHILLFLSVETLSTTELRSTDGVFDSIRVMSCSHRLIIGAFFSAQLGFFSNVTLNSPLSTTNPIQKLNFHVIFSIHYRNATFESTVDLIESILVISLRI